MIKGLVFQALQHDPTPLHSSPEELNVTRFQSNHTEAEWISLLLQLLSRLSKCFIIVEAEDIFQVNRAAPDWAKDFLEPFRKLVDEAEGSGNQPKILVLGCGSILLTVQCPAKRIAFCRRSSDDTLCHHI
jgi:hypothetical protein